MLRIVFFSLCAVIISGCSTGYRCPLGHDCTDSMEALEQAKTDGGNDESVFIEPEEYPEFGENTDEIDESDSVEAAHMKKLGMGHLSGKPVYLPDSPMRIWVAPEEFTSNAGEPIYLVDGYHLYGMIKGGWLIGNQIKRSSDSMGSNSSNFGMIGPLDEKKNLGFRATTKRKESSSPIRQIFK